MENKLVYIYKNDFKKDINLPSEISSSRLFQIHGDLMEKDLITFCFQSSLWRKQRLNNSIMKYLPIVLQSLVTPIRKQK